MNAKRDWSDLLNPVLVKEIRQYFHNYLILGLTWVLLVGLLTFMVFVITTVDKGSSVNGREFLEMISFTILGVCFCICGIAGQLRFAAERGTSELDYSRISPLSPGQIIRGKTLAAMIMAGYLIFLTLPFVLISYFMNQVSIGEIFRDYLFILFVLSLYSTVLGLFFGVFGFRWMIGLYVPAAMLLLWGILVYCICSDYSAYGRGILDIEEIWLFCLILFFTGLIFVWTLGLTRSAGYNRMHWARIYLSSLVLLFPAVCFCVFKHENNWIWRVLQFCFYGGMFGTVIMALQSACEKDRPPYHVLRNAPGGWLKRLGVFLFIDGWGGGLLLCWGMLLLMMLILRIIPFFPAYFFVKNAEGLTKSGYGFIALSLYVVFFAELAIRLRLWIKVPGWISLSIVFVLLGIVPVVISNVGGWYWCYDSIIYLINVPMGATNYADHRIREIYYTGWGTALFGLLLVGWPLLQNFRAFRQIGKEKQNECEA